MYVLSSTQMKNRCSAIPMLEDELGVIGAAPLLPATRERSVTAHNLVSIREAKIRT